MADLCQRYFDPTALLAEDAVGFKCPQQSQQHLQQQLLTVVQQRPLQLVPCEFVYAVELLGKLLDPTSTSADVRNWHHPADLGIAIRSYACADHAAALLAWLHPLSHAGLNQQRQLCMPDALLLA